VLTTPQRHIDCRTTEQLGVALQRAGSTPLELDIRGMPELNMVELIVSHSSPIHSLAIDGGEATGSIVDKLEYLDFRDLKRLFVMEMPYNEMEELMDLALESVHEEMDVEIHSLEQMPADFLVYEIFQWVSRLAIGCCQ
jgi:hypothetical protein